MTNKEYLSQIGLEIRVARTRKRMTAKAVGKLCGLHESTISEIELGKNDAHILTYKRIADALGVSIKDFL